MTRTESNVTEPLAAAGTAHDTEVAVERMTAEELLRGLEGLAPPEEQPEEELDALGAEMRADSEEAA